jgi:hypothetical protein
MTQLNDNGRNELAALASRHGVSEEAARHLLGAIIAGGGKQAQFNHPELGGMGQWSKGGMIMIGDMFNHCLKSRIDTLCSELSALAARRDLFAAGSEANRVRAAGAFSPDRWWPEGLGEPGASGAQNGSRYAFFPQSHRLAIDCGGRVRVFDTRDHRIAGVSQQQSGAQTLTFTSQHGSVDLASLDEVSVNEEPEPEPAEFGAVLAEAFASEEPVARPSEAPEQRSAGADIIDMIERLADLHKRAILTDQEFQSKKAELLARI